MSDEFDEIVADIEDELDLTLYADIDELADEVTAQILLTIEAGLLAKGEFHLVLTGGTLGVQIASALRSAWNAAPDMYQGLHIWWSDERFVERGSSDHNCAPMHQMVSNKNLTIHNVPASNEVASIEEAVEDYLTHLGENFMDLTILGLGPDGHVASLFPGSDHLDRLEKVIAISDSPKPPAVRATFTMSMINSSTLVWIIASGASKAEAVTKIIEGGLSIPASYVRAVDHTRLIVDADAFFTE